ncbi:hypothetical protein GNI_138380 [Gregarina niphandrodes]|uniref:Uncharacterized protein n=1 Tax=Gregarina niphandrodes TaxID=110365 RepID=A0A023B0M4_GRENI|nr:hypothetical protein GNI_138380 [Gregarina niphandrodes]EZG45470.1 hypothetical protein GNI_138380 [Gregarina niphandrodes]|eukprot:XP_011132488.1 hypothetical protein GNI_138380 [Gregarina niphandrodes]
MDPSWCDFLNLGYLDMSKMKCKSTNTLMGRFIKWIPEWLRTVLFHKVGIRAFTPVEEVVRIVTEGDTGAAKRQYPLPVVPKQVKASGLLYRGGL